MADSKYEQGIALGMDDEEARNCHLPWQEFDRIFAERPDESEIMSLPEGAASDE